MKAISIAAMVVTLGLATAARADITLVDNDRTVDIDCTKDPEVSLLGNHLTITTKGVCAKISVSGNHETVTGSASVVQVLGNHNTITLNAADDVSVAGNHNTITVRKAVTRKAPRISNSGTRNQITKP